MTSVFLILGIGGAKQLRLDGLDDECGDGLTGALGGMGEEVKTVLALPAGSEMHGDSNLGLRHWMDLSFYTG